MLSNNDVQLFYRLLDSLGNSLKELAVRYELLVRASEGNTKGVSDLSKEVTGLGRSFDKIERSIGDAKEKLVSGFTTVERTIEKCNREVSEIREAVARIHNASSVGAEQMTEIAGAVRHLDQHMDGYSRALGEIDGKLGDTGAAVREIMAVKTDLEPVIDLSRILRGPLQAIKEHLKKPVTLLLAIYVLLASAVAFTKASSWVWKQMPDPACAAKQPAPGAHTNAAALMTNMVASP